MSTVWIRVSFGVVLAMLVALTAIFGVAMAAPGPTPPEDPGVTFSSLSGGEDDARSQNTLTQKIDKFYEDAKNYRDDFPGWQRNAALALTGVGIVLVLIGLALPAVVNFLRLGLVLGSGLLFWYSFMVFRLPVPDVTPEGTSLLALLGAGEPEPLDFAGRFALFAVCFIGLILALFLGLWRLTEWTSAPRRATAAAPATSPSHAPLPPTTPAAAAQWAPPSSTPSPSPPPAPSPAPTPAPSPTVLEYAPARSNSEPRPSSEPPKADEPESEWSKKSDA